MEVPSATNLGRRERRVGPPDLRGVVGVSRGDGERVGGHARPRHPRALPPRCRHRESTRQVRTSPTASRALAGPSVIGGLHRAV